MSRQFVATHSNVYRHRCSTFMLRGSTLVFSMPEAKAWKRLETVVSLNTSGVHGVVRSLLWGGGRNAHTRLARVLRCVSPKPCPFRGAGWVSPALLATVRVAQLTADERPTAEHVSLEVVCVWVYVCTFWLNLACPLALSCGGQNLSLCRPRVMALPSWSGTRRPSCFRCRTGVPRT